MHRAKTHRGRDQIESLNLNHNHTHTSPVARSFSANLSVSKMTRSSSRSENEGSSNAGKDLDLDETLPFHTKNDPKKREYCTILEQEDIYTKVFCQLEELNVIDYKYLVAVVVEYIRCLNYQFIKVSSFIYELVIVLLVRNNKFYQLHQFLQYHVITDSFHVACQLLSLEKTYPPAHQLALDMLKRTFPKHIIDVLLSKGQVIQALRFVKNQRYDILSESKRFFEIALQSEDPTVFFTVYNYFKRENDTTWQQYTKIFNEKYYPNH